MKDQRERREKGRTRKSCEGEITKSEYKNADRTVPEEKLKGMQIRLVMDGQVMGIHRALVNGKDKDGLHLGWPRPRWPCCSCFRTGKGEKKSQRFEKLQEKIKDLGLACMCAAEENHRQRSLPD